VDDDDDLLMLAYHVLHTIGGYRVESFRRGRRALAFCRRTRPDLLITDMYRPGLDGKGLCHAIRMDDTLANLPIVIFSACLSRALDPMRVYDVTFLRKPCTWQQILATAEGLIPRV
jgi:CheY-like chemotaxis protein